MTVAYLCVYIIFMLRKLKKYSDQRGSSLIMVAFLVGVLSATVLLFGWSQIKNGNFSFGAAEAHVDDPHFSPLPPCNTSTSTTDTSGFPVVITYPVDMSCVQSGSTVVIQGSVPDPFTVKKVKFDIYTNYLPKGKGVTYKFTCEDTTTPYTCDWQVPKGKVQGWTFYIAPSVESNSGNILYGQVIRVYTAN